MDMKSDYPDEWREGRYAFKQNKGSGSNPYRSDVRGRFKRLAWNGGYNEAREEFIRKIGPK